MPLSKVQRWLRHGTLAQLRVFEAAARLGSFARAADELHADQFITDATWAALSAHFAPKQCVDVIYTAGQYTLVSMMLNSLGVQLDEGQVLDPDLRKG